jgi:S-adenosylmethionine synthetase
MDCGVAGPKRRMAEPLGTEAERSAGKDPSKVDRGSAYFCRLVAGQNRQAGLAEPAEVQVAYAIGRSQAVSTMVNTFGIGNPKGAAEYLRTLDFRPAAAIEILNLLRPIYRRTTNCGHFGRPSLLWEE